MKKAKKTYRLDYTKVALVIGVFVGALLILNAINKRKHATIESVIIDITPIDGAHFLLDSADVAYVVRRSAGQWLTGTRYSALDVEGLEGDLRQTPFIENAEVFLTASHDLEISITQRQPTLRIIDNASRDYYLDANGAAMPISEHYTARSMVVTGDLPPYRSALVDQEGSVFHELLTLVNYIKADPYRRALVEQIHRKGDDFILIPKIGDQKIIFGSTDRMEEKFSNLFVFYDEAMPREGWNKYATLNLKYKDQVVGKRRRNHALAKAD